jgi:hypothetical protein
MTKTAPMMRLCAGTRRRGRDEPAPSVDLGRGPIPLGGTIATASSSTTEPNLAFVRQMTPSSPRVRVENAPNGGTVQVCWLCALFRGLDGIRSLGLRALGRRFHPCPSLGSVRKDFAPTLPADSNARNGDSSQVFSAAAAQATTKMYLGSIAIGLPR